MTATNFTPIDDLITRYKQEQAAASGSVTKEMEPRPSQRAETFLQEKSGEVEKLDPDVTPYIEVSTTDQVQLDPELAQAGIQTIMPSSIPQYLNVKLPISDEKILAGKKQPFSSSLRWLSTLALYVLAKAHISLKVVGGKVTRVMQG